LSKCDIAGEVPVILQAVRIPVNKIISGFNSAERTDFMN
jgi:hypothetical protein